MKKILIVLLSSFLFLTRIFCVEIKYKVLRDSFYDDGNYNTFPINKDTILEWTDNNECYLKETDGIYRIELEFEDGNEYKYISSYDLLLENSEVMFYDNDENQSEITYEIIPDYYLEVLSQKNPSIIFQKQPKWNVFKEAWNNSSQGNQWTFEEGFFPESMVLNNNFVKMTSQNFYLIEKIVIEKNIYKVQLFRPFNWLYGDEFQYEQPYANEYLNYKDEKRVVFYFDFDGDFVNIWINNKNAFLGRYFVATAKTIKEIKNLMENNTCDLSNITWPRHADGSCDYDGSKKTAAVQTVKATPSTNVAQNKTMTVTENLKLRSGEATTSDILTVLQAGTRVKILEVGKAETIDGISSNWVQVEVQAGAKDRDGKTITKGTVGWCFGGYLE